MANDAIFSPCVSCYIHQHELDKLDPKNPCSVCAAREAYAESIYGMPARVFADDDMYLHEDGLDIFYLFKDGLKLVD